MHNIDGLTNVYGLIANPIEHTSSPFFHNMVTTAMGMNNIYVPFWVKDGLIEDAVKSFKALNIKGFNVTIPYKLDIMSHLDSIDDKAIKIGAVNTVKIEGDKLVGYNTDGDGLYKSCIKNGVVFEGKTVCILGAGGAARGVAVMCADAEVKKLIIVNRSINKANNIKSMINNYYDIEVEALSMDQMDMINRVDLCFQTTSIGMHPNEDGCIISDAGFFKGVEYAIDLIYNPSETLFLKYAKEQGTKTINGLEMLYYQGLKSIEIWNNTKVPEEIANEGLLKFNEHIYNQK